MSERLQKGKVMTTKADSFKKAKKNTVSIIAKELAKRGVLSNSEQTK